MDESPNAIGYLATLLWDEVLLYGMRYLIGGGVVMIGAVLFGRGYKKRIAAVEAELVAIKRNPYNLTIDEGPGYERQEPVQTGKTWCSLTPKEIAALTASRSTDLARERVLAPYQNTWLRVQGPVEDVSLSFGGGVDVKISLPDDLNVHLSMREDLYTAEDFTDVKKGDLFTGDGKVDSATDNGLLFLEECERVP